ncbi:MAG: amidohydrolase [Candidatus Bathyarchaeota archaeon]|nr:amidohydrolase [Candidatus Bathyarchaeota archaeon]
MEKADILIRGCAVLPMDGRSLIEDGAIAIKNGRIIFVGKSTSAEGISAEEKIDAKGKVAMPGLVNCHTHVSMTLFRGLAEDKPLDVWLRETIWPLEARLNCEDIYVGALLGCLEMLKSGTTCFADMYFHEDMVARAVFESGLRGVLAEGIIEAGNKEQGGKTLNRSVNFAKNFSGYANGRITAMLAPHAAYSCSPELLRKVKDKASELGIGVHTHLAESANLFMEFEKKYGCSEVEFLNNLGFFEGHVLAAHCINLSDNDRHVLAESGVNVVYVPVANMKLGLGAARIKELVELGVNVALGTDGAASNNTLDMFETVNVGALLQKLTYLDSRVLSAYEVLRMATLNGAKALGLDTSIGSLEVGKEADIIMVDFSKPHLKPLHDVCAALVYSARGSDVDTVIVDGKILMENRQVKTLDEQAVIEKAERHAAELLARKP